MQKLFHHILIGLGIILLASIGFLLYQNLVKTESDGYKGYFSLKQEADKGFVGNIPLSEALLKNHRSLSTERTIVPETIALFLKQGPMPALEPDATEMAIVSCSRSIAKWLMPPIGLEYTHILSLELEVGDTSPEDGFFSQGTAQIQVAVTDPFGMQKDYIVTYTIPIAFSKQGKCVAVGAKIDPRQNKTSEAVAKEFLQRVYRDPTVIRRLIVSHHKILNGINIAWTGRSFDHPYLHVTFYREPNATELIRNASTSFSVSMDIVTGELKVDPLITSISDFW